MFAPSIGLLLTTLGIAVWLILRYFLRRVEGIADEISKKSVESFSRKLDVAFRDEELRSRFRLEIAKQSAAKKLAHYHSVYGLYFEYQDCWSWTTATPKDEINRFWHKVLETRQNLFLASIFLGPDLYDYLSTAVGSIMTCLQTRKTTASGTTTEMKWELKIHKNITSAGHWLVENLITHQDVKMYEPFSADQIASLEEERKRVIKATI